MTPEIMRVLVANNPPLLRDCLAQAIAIEPQYDVATERATDTEILRSAWRFRADYVFVTLDNPEYRPRICRVVLSRCPRSNVVAVGRKTLIEFWMDDKIQIRSCRIYYSLGAILGSLKRKYAYLNLPRNGNGPPVPTATPRHSGPDSTAGAAMSAC